MKTDLLFLGIDPGISGAWALLREDGTIATTGLWEDVDFLIATAKAGYNTFFCCLEKCHAMPRQGVTSMFTFGENVGYWKGLLKGLGMAYIETTPQKWQKEILDFIPVREAKQPEASSKEEAARLARNRTILKGAVVEFVKRRFPDSAPLLQLKKNQGIADAICLAAYAKKMYGG